MADYQSQQAGKLCTKYKNQTKALTPGLFVMHCMKCKSCIGFHMMPASESPRTLFEVVYTRWRRPPRLIVYDNNCHAHAYFLNREPQFVKDTTFLIDKIHFKGHVGCCIGYDIAAYPEYGSWNSQLHEQKVSFASHDAGPCLLLPCA
jgi:hypothetical protein